jgi:Mg2+ and Co2+ transporter CorA
MISFSTAQITERLDHGRQLAEQFGKIGMVIAAITGVVAPLSLITGYYGMNVKEFTPGAELSLFDVWQIGTPIVLVTVICTAFIGLWMLTGQQRVLSTMKES